MGAEASEETVGTAVARRLDRDVTSGSSEKNCALTLHAKTEAPKMNEEIRIMSLCLKDRVCIIKGAKTSDHEVSILEGEDTLLSQPYLLRTTVTASCGSPTLNWERNIILTVGANLQARKGATVPSCGWTAKIKPRRLGVLVHQEIKITCKRKYRVGMIAAAGMGRDYMVSLLKTTATALSDNTYNHK